MQSRVQTKDSATIKWQGTWFGWNIEKVGPVQDKGLYEQAKSFAVSANKGDVTTKHGEEDTKSKDSVPF